MVADVRISDVVESMVEDGTERAVDSAESTPEPVPLLPTEVGHEYVGVLEVGDEDEVVVDYGVGDQVVCGDIGKTWKGRVPKRKKNNGQKGNTICWKSLYVLLFKRHTKRTESVDAEAEKRKA